MGHQARRRGGRRPSPIDFRPRPPLSLCRLCLLACALLMMPGCNVAPTGAPASTPAVPSAAAAASAPTAPVPARSSEAAATLAPAAGMAGERRIALVIGNGDYSSAPLLNPVNDARAISEALRTMGFQVTRLENATGRQMSEAARDFGDALRQDTVGLFFYAGHGMQIKGRNYLIPIGADIQREDEVPFNAFDAGLLLEKMETAHSRVNIVILDACRNNPFARSFRSSSQGLAQMDAPVGSYLSFATAPARVASDGKDGNGLYTAHLLRAMQLPGLKIEDVFKRVRIGVMADSEGQQVPWDNSSLTGDFYFIPPAAAAAAPVNTPLAAAAPAARPAPTAAVPPRLPPARQPLLDRDTSAALAALFSSGVAAKGSGDLAAAAKAFGQAAAGGHAEAAYEMALLLELGRKPVTQDLPQSQRLFLQAAQQGIAGAQYRAARMLAQGIGTPRNCAQAISWAHKAAVAGVAEAALLLGELHVADCNGATNPQEAARWFRVAAEQGLANAQFSLGVLYLTGNGVEKDLQEARKWLTAAADNGNAAARFYLSRLDQ